MTDRLKLELKLLDKSFTIACSSEQVSEFENSANYLSTKLKHITSKTKALNFDKALTMVALNITHELLQARSEKSNLDEQLVGLIEKTAEILQDLEAGLEDNLQESLKKIVNED